MDIDSLLSGALAETGPKPTPDISDLNSLLDEMQRNENAMPQYGIEHQLQAVLSTSKTKSYADLDSEPYEPDLSPASIYDPDVISFQQSILESANSEQVLIATNEINISTIQIGDTPVVIEQTPSAKLAITSENIDTILQFALNEVSKIQDATAVEVDKPTSEVGSFVPSISVDEKDEILPTASTPVEEEFVTNDPLLEKIKSIKQQFDRVEIPVNQVALDDTNAFKSEIGFNLAKFPKQYARITTNIQKQAEWYVSALEHHGDAGSQAIAVINEIKENDTSLEAIQLVGNNILFGNPYGPLQKHKQLTKEELKDLARAEEKAKQQRLIQEAVERAAQSVMPEHQSTRDKFREIISDIKSMDVMNAETARLNSILKSNREQQSRESEVNNTEEVQVNLNIAYSPAQKGDSENSYYAIISNDRVIATGLANNFPPALLTTMAKEASGYLLWSAKPFEIDLGQFKVLTQTQSQVSATRDKFESEVEKGLEQIKSSYLIVQPQKADNALSVQTVEAHQPGPNVNSTRMAEINDNIKSRITTLMELAEEKNRVVKFYHHKEDANSVLVVSGEGERMKFATIARNGNLMKLPDAFNRNTFASLLAKSQITELSVQEHLDQNLSDGGLAP